MTEALVFTLVALVSVAGALGVLFSRNVVRAAYAMLMVMVATAGVFLLLEAEFLALVQILVYAGAVAVLTLFVIMLTLRRREDAERPLDSSPWAAALAGIFGVAAFALSASFRPAAASGKAATTVAALGKELFTTWGLPFELASLVLLVALVGAVWWAGGDDK